MGTATTTLSLCQWPSSFSSSSLRMHVRFSCRTPHLSASAVNKTLCQINNSGVIACLRANSAEVAMEAANAAIARGILVLEIVVSTPGVFEVLQQLVKEHPTMALGILSACDAGAKMVKVYPVSALGGFQYISALKKPFPHVSMVASQGITIDAIEEYILRGASSVVLSDAIFDKEELRNIISVRYINLHILLPCWVTKL
ncbi:lyase protein [Spatholobus suberectus]|nr:lyase protein [Spatholobus suberectus]